MGNVNNIFPNRNLRNCYTKKKNNDHKKRGKKREKESMKITCEKGYCRNGQQFQIKLELKF